MPNWEEKFMGNKTQSNYVSRRAGIGILGAGAGIVAAGTVLPTKFAIGAKAKIKIGTLLPYSGTYTWLGNSITNSLELLFAQAGGKLGGREINLI